MSLGSGGISPMHHILPEVQTESRRAESAMCTKSCRGCEDRQVVGKKGHDGGA
jgi:hypothetical protein